MNLPSFYLNRTTIFPTLAQHSGPCFAIVKVCVFNEWTRPSSLGVCFSVDTFMSQPFEPVVFLLVQCSSAHYSRRRTRRTGHWYISSTLCFFVAAGSCCHICDPNRFYRSRSTADTSAAAQKCSTTATVRPLDVAHVCWKWDGNSPCIYIHSKPIFFQKHTDLDIYVVRGRATYLSGDVVMYLHDGYLPFFFETQVSIFNRTEGKSFWSMWWKQTQIKAKVLQHLSRQKQNGFEASFVSMSS